MKKIILTTSIVILIIIAIFVFNGRKNEQASNQHNLSVGNNNFASRQDDAPAPSNNNEYQTQTDSQADVTVEVTPKQLDIGKEKNIFTVSLNTHSVELDFDFTKIMILKDDLDSVYPATEWTGNRGWHHVNGDIIFPKINEQASSVELQINGINGVDRNFKWTLK